MARQKLPMEFIVVGTKLDEKDVEHPAKFMFSSGLKSWTPKVEEATKFKTKKEAEKAANRVGHWNWCHAEVMSYPMAWALTYGIAARWEFYSERKLAAKERRKIIATEPSTAQNPEAVVGEGEHEPRGQ